MSRNTVVFALLVCYCCCVDPKQYNASSFIPIEPRHHHHGPSSTHRPQHPPTSQLHGGRDMETGKNPTKFDGSDMTITEYPHPVLRRRAHDVVDFDQETNRVCQEMMTIMYQADGVGLAAPQVNLGLRLFVYNPTGNPDRPEAERVVCNPTILEYSSAVEVQEEACLSSRSGRCGGDVARSLTVMVEYRNAQGNLVRRKLEGFEARVFQHEYDHVVGVLHFDRFAPEDRVDVQEELDVMIRDYKEKEEPVFDLEEEVKASLRPPPMPRRGWMPPLVTGMMEKKKKKTKKKKAGFGAGGFGKS